MTLKCNLEEKTINNKKLLIACSSTLDLCVISTTLCYNFKSNTRNEKKKCSVIRDNVVYECFRVLDYL